MIEDVTIGLASGMAAAGPMTLFMEAAHHALPKGQQHPLPPRHISQKLTSALGLRFTERQNFAIAVLSHFAYGAVAGSLFAPLIKRTGVQPVAGGVAFGLMVWAGSYMGGLPAVGLYPSPAKDPVRRTAIMVAAHVVWGATLGLLVNSLQKSSETSASLAGKSGTLSGAIHAR